MYWAKTATIFFLWKTTIVEYVYIYIHIHIYIHMYIYIYIHIYIPNIHIERVSERVRERDKEIEYYSVLWQGDHRLVHFNSVIL